MKSFWLFLPHLLRGIIGCRLHGKIPKSHEVVGLLEFDSESGVNQGFSAVHKRVRYSMEKAYFGFVKESQCLFKVYFATTCIGGIMDFFNFLVVYNHFGEKGDEYSEIVLMLLTLSYLASNMYWIGYAVML